MKKQETIHDNEKIEKSEKKNKLVKHNSKKIILYIIILAVVIYVLYTIYLLIIQPTNIFTIEEGKLYIALPPLYKLDYGKKHYYAYSDDELESIKKEHTGKYSIQRYKGLGEMNADQLWETTMNPETRSLIKVNIIDAALAEKRVSVLMGDKVEPRKEWINENVEFTMEDNYRAK